MEVYTALQHNRATHNHQQFISSFQRYFTQLYQHLPDKPNGGPKKIVVRFFADRAERLTKSILALDGVSQTAIYILYRCLLETTIETFWIACQEEAVAKRVAAYENFDKFWQKLQYYQYGNSQTLALLDEALQLYRDQKTLFKRFIKPNKYKKVQELLEKVETQKETLSGSFMTLKNCFSTKWYPDNVNFEKVFRDVCDQFDNSPNTYGLAPGEFQTLRQALYPLGHAMVHGSPRSFSIVNPLDNSRYINSVNDEDTAFLILGIPAVIRVIQAACFEAKLIDNDTDGFCDQLYREVIQPLMPLEDRAE